MFRHVDIYMHFSFQELLLVDQTKALAANIYEAFSQSDDIEDEIEDQQFQPWSLLYIIGPDQN